MWPGMFDRRHFHRRLQIVIQHHFDGNQKKFNTAIGQRDAVTKWRDSKPSLDAILTISEKFNVSANWLLFGIGPQQLETHHNVRVEEGFLRLAGLLGIEDGFRWIDKIARKLKIPAHRFTACISNNTIDDELLAQIEAQGFPASRWLQQPKPDSQDRSTDRSNNFAEPRAVIDKGRR
jgi:hypothetical protein